MQRWHSTFMPLSKCVASSNMPKDFCLTVKEIEQCVRFPFPLLAIDGLVRQNKESNSKDFQICVCMRLLHDINCLSCGFF